MAKQSFSLASKVKLNNGLTMPHIHLGVYLMNGNEATKAVGYALDAGYRAIDSAQMYHNESDVGRAITTWLSSQSTLKREDLHYTTKLASCTDYARARKSISDSVKRCGLGYIDLFLLHSPYGGKTARLESWRALEDAIAAGEVRSAGVSNFGIKHLRELLASEPRVRPVVNQIEVHPFNTHEDITGFCRDEGIVVEAYAPLVRALKMGDSTVVRLAEKYGCTPAQVLVRWSLQKGYVPLPKSVRREKIVENARVEGFEIEEADVRVLDGLDEGLVTDWDPLDAD